MSIRKDNILVIIPARGGSKGIPRKNIKPLMGKPLIQYTIDLALKQFKSDQILVSTDDEEIRAFSESCGLHVPDLRSEHLSRDESSTYDVLIDIIEHRMPSEHSYEAILLLQPTSPFRGSRHIEEAIELYNASLDMVVAVKETKSNPYFNLFEENELGLLKPSKNGNYPGRQYVPKVYEYNGAMYLMNMQSLKKQKISEFTKIKKMVMDRTSSLDIDDEMDWKVAELVLKNNLFELD